MFYPPSAYIITSFCFVVLLLHPDHSAIMNDPDDFGLGDISPNTLEAQHQQEQEPEQESNNPDNFGFGDISPITLKEQHQQEQEPEQESNDPDNFGFGDISPNTLEAEHQQEQEHNTSTQQNTAATPPKKK